MTSHSQFPPAAFACLIIVGPREQTIALDTLDSVKAYYPHADCWIVDDATTDGTFERLQGWVAGHGGTLLRNAQPNGYLGLVNSVLFGLDAIARSGIPYAFVCKIDTDTCFCGPGLDERLLARFTEHGPGIAGAVRINPEGAPRYKAHFVRRLLLDMLPAGISKQAPKLRLGWPFFVPTLFRALARGYHLGESAFGACYAVHAETLQALRCAGFLKHHQTPLRALCCEEDLLLSIAAVSVGHRLIELDLRRDEAITWLGFKEKPDFSATQARALGYAVIHPLKQTPEALPLREDLKQLRPG